MDFKYNLQSQMDLKEEINCDFNDDDDDVFYTELRRQILLLTAEDDDYEDNGEIPESKHSNSARGAKRGLGSGCCSAALLPGSYFGWLENEETNAVPPTWLVNLWRHGNGTGVFIPRIVKSRRGQKPRGRKNDRKNIQANAKQERMTV